MKVTAFVRETSAKNNRTDQTHIYFRVRDGKTDIKAVSELSINPNHWSPERQGYKSRVALVDEDKRTKFDKAVQDLTALISSQYYRGADSAWLKGVIEKFHHPNINMRQDKKGDEFSLTYHASSMPTIIRWQKRQLDTMSIMSARLNTLSVISVRLCADVATPCVLTR